MNKEQTEYFRQRLTGLRAELLASIEGRREAAGTVHLDQQMVGRLSRMDAMQMQSMAKAEDARARVLLRQIEAALERMQRDEYGWCAKCGEAIAIARLEAAPATPFCNQCAV